MSSEVVALDSEELLGKKLSPDLQRAGILLISTVANASEPSLKRHYQKKNCLGK